MSRAMWNRIMGTACVALAGAAAAQDLSGPNSGFVYDKEEKAIRLIAGIPGAAYLGDALAGGLDGASISPDGRRALAARSGRLALISTLDASEVDLGEWAGDLALVAWSGDGNAVAAKGAGLALYRHLDSTPEAATLGSVDGDVTALAVAGRGDAVIVATAAALYRVGESAELLASLEGVTALAVNTTGDRLYAASAARKEVYEIGGLNGSADLALLFGEAAGLDAPSALGISADGTVLYVADRGSHSLSAVRLGTAETLFAVDLAFDASSMERMSGGRFLMKSAAAGDSIEIFDPARQAVLFVPRAGAFETQAAGSVEE